MVKSKFTPEQKIQTMLESIRTGTSTAELCRKHNVHPQTFHNWKQRFMESGKAGLSQSGKKDPIKTMKKREEDYKRLGTAKSRSAGPRHGFLRWNRRSHALLFSGIVQ